MNRDLYADYTNQEYRASFAVHSSGSLTCRILTLQTCQYHFYKRTVKQKGNKSIYQKDPLVAIEKLTTQLVAVPLEYDQQKRDKSLGKQQITQRSSYSLLHLRETNVHDLYTYLMYDKYLFYKFPKNLGSVECKAERYS